MDFTEMFYAYTFSSTKKVWTTLGSIFLNFILEIVCFLVLC